MNEDRRMTERAAEMAGIRPEALKNITEEDVKEALGLLEKYKQEKEILNNRIRENEYWWELRQWELMAPGDGGKDKAAKRASAWLFNSLINKHADFMDNFPAPNILAREESDKEAAKILSSVVPCILDQCSYEDVYSDECWDKLKSGTGVYGIFWDPYKEGIGDIEIRNIDLLQLTWEPGVENIQKTPNLFFQSYVDDAVIRSQYPEMRNISMGSVLNEIPEYQGESRKFVEGKTLVTDWYYKKTVHGVTQEGIKTRKTVVHLCKICQGKILYATENDPQMQEGLYDHGLYPFVFDVLFPKKQTPAGMGYIDIMKDTQMAIDQMGKAILKNGIVGATPRYLSKDGNGINETEFADIGREVVHYTGNPTDIVPIEHYPLDGAYVTVQTNKIEELKETSGNRDFSQGSTTSGVTAASAIAALQEAGSKLSRDMIKTSYRAHRDVVYQVIELIRQFYTAERAFRITGADGVEQYVRFNNASLRPEAVTEDFGLLLGGRKPYFDIKISAQKASPFTKIAQNELAKELYNLGFFNPQLVDQAALCLDMMDFDGKEEVLRKIKENGTMYQKLLLMEQQMQQMAAVIAKATGDTRLFDALQMQGTEAPGQVTAVAVNGGVETDTIGNVTRKNDSSAAAKARRQAASATTPKA